MGWGNQFLGAGDGFKVFFMFIPTVDGGNPAPPGMYQTL